MNKKQPMILSVHQRGTSEFPRWCIADQFGRYFDGKGWSGVEGSALLYADLNTACHDLQKLQMIPFQTKRVRRYRAPVYVEVFTDKKIPLEQVREWLLKVSCLLIDSPRHGLGPVPDTLGLVRIQWSELKETKK